GQFGFGQIEVWRTRDGGNTWHGPAVAGPEAADSRATCGDAGTLQQSSVPAFGPKGEVYVTWQFGPTFDAAGQPSPDAGVRAAAGAKRVSPSVTASANGESVDVVYYESLDQTMTGAACNVSLGGAARRIGPLHSLVNTRLVHSDNAGTSFGNPLTVSSVTTDW